MVCHFIYISKNFYIESVQSILHYRDNSSIVVNSSGKNVYVVWEEYNGTDYDVYFAKSTDRGRSFSTDIKVYDDLEGVDQRYPVIATDSSGQKIYIVWQQKDSSDLESDWDLYLASSGDAGMIFTSHIIPIDDEGDQIPWNQTNPVIDFRSSDNIYLAWCDDRDDPAIYFASSSNGGDDFAGSVLVVDNAITEAPSYPSLKVTSGGNIYIAWNAGSKGNHHIFLEISIDGGLTFESYQPQIDGGTSDATKPSLDVRGSGKVGEPDEDEDENVNVCIAWQNLADGDEDIYFDKSIDFGATFGVDVQVNEDSVTPQPQKNPSLAIDNSGDIYIVWHDQRNSEYGDQGDIYLAQSTDKGNSFNTNILMNDDAGTATQNMPSIVLDVNGKHVNICWTDYRNGTADIYFVKNTVITVSKSLEIDCDDGGTVILDDVASELYGAEVEIPTGALEADTTITIGEVDNPPDLPEGGFGVPIHLGPSGLTFDEPVTVTVPYDPSDSPGDTIEVYYYDTTIDAWTNEGITFVSIDRVAHTVTFTTTHFSIFGFGSSFLGGGGGAIAAIGGGGSGCFIATAAYGTPMSEEVGVLSEFRDRYLLTNSFGKRFVSLYYKLSPPVADYISERGNLKSIVRTLLKPFIWFSKLVIG